jgi:4-amino-4-deoxy-L-arabinose transferase-like glycosyltransferase
MSKILHKIDNNYVNGLIFLLCGLILILTVFSVSPNFIVRPLLQVLYLVLFIPSFTFWIIAVILKKKKFKVLLFLHLIMLAIFVFTFYHYATKNQVCWFSSTCKVDF